MLQVGFAIPFLFLVLGQLAVCFLYWCLASRSPFYAALLLWFNGISLLTIYLYDGRQDT